MAERQLLDQVHGLVIADSKYGFYTYLARMEPCLGYLDVLRVNETNLGLLIHNYPTMCTTKIGISKILKVKP